ncbi:MAG: type II secretion system protein [Chitinivibrionales bacterium]|nr:type II secretion system protein [Chitinivibrionales bacterium]
MNKDTGHSSIGFALIKLLLVISIVSLLIAVLVPALAKCKELTRRIVFQSYLHQFALVTIAYATDFENNMPSFKSPAGPHLHDISDEFMEYINLNYGLIRKIFIVPVFPCQ